MKKTIFYVGLVMALLVSTNPVFAQSNNSQNSNASNFSGDISEIVINKAVETYRGSGITNRIPAGTTILNFTNNGGIATTTDLEPMLTSIGATVTTIVGATAELNTALTSQTFDLAIIRFYNDTIDAATITEIVNYISGGGKVIFGGYWQINIAPTLLAELGAASAISYGSQIAVEVWDPAHPTFNNPNTINGLPLVAPTVPWGIHGHRLEPLPGATSIAGFVATPNTPNETAILLNAAGTTIYNSFISTNFDSQDFIDLIENQAEFLFASASNPPIINCPGDQIVNANPGECEAPFGFATPTALDPDGGSVTVTQTMGAPSPGPYPVGVTTIEFTATNDDAPNETTTCQFTITVVDNQVAVLTCPADITQTNDAGLCEALVTVPQPTVADNCPTDPAGLVNDYNGTADATDVYPVGTTIVTWTYTDGGGNSVDCTMNVTVTDDEAPEILCVGAPPSGAGTATTTPGTAIPDSNPAGLTTTLDITDDFNITDLDVDLDISHTWVGDIIVTLTAPDGTTSATIVDRPGAPATGTFGCSGNDILATLDDEAATAVEDECGGGVPTIAGSFIPNEALSVFDGISTLGTWTLNVSDNGGGDTGTLNAWSLNYTYDAVASAPLDVILDVNGMATVNVADLLVSVTDNCGIASIEILGGATIPDIDECGDNAGAVISNTLPPTESNATVPDSGIIGVDYALNSVEIDITHSWDSDLEIELESPSGTILTLSDGNGGSGDNYTGTVFMDGAPNITTGSAPFTGTFEPEGGTFAATFDGEDVNGDWILRATDDAAGDDGVFNSYCINFISLNSSQAQFTCTDVGESTVDILVTDTSGNTSMCTATVNVIDNIAPMLVCKDFTLELGADGTAMLDPMDLIDMNLTVEACGISVAGVDMDDFSCDDIGTPQMVTLFVSDPSGNLASCVATVTVVDLLEPVVTCPADMTIDPGAGNQLYEVPDYFADGLASAVDNCTDPLTVFAQDPAAGSFIGDGVYTVTLSATDAFGNVGECTFELTIESILGVNDNTLETGITLYPNPAQSQVTLSNTSNILLNKATMYDVNGKLVNTVDLTSMTTEKTIDISKLASGVYIVQIESENASVVKRLIKE
ncbi:proprotein convertase P-domain-containing protein [Rasiella sp. SM2506]|uniref:proprotein convertase P-domain-containing protein n=1 Tax=Rasiella sp. SM2506 TaxID=3423914 RepID=UPI003D790375